MAASQTLIDLAQTQRALVAQYLTSLAPNADNDSTSQLPPNPPNPLHVLRDSATLLKAHTTKLALLLINKPFTPTAVTTVLRDATQTCLPAMMSAVELCRPDIWGVFLHHQVVAKVRTVMREMVSFLEEVLDVARQVDTANHSKDTLASTGVLWEACDALVQLDSTGIAGLAVLKAQELRDTINDAIEELKEWEEGDGDDDDEDDDDEDDDDADSTTSDDKEERDDQDEFDDMFSAANRLPKDRTDLKERLQTAADKLKKIQFLYAAITKRRLKTFTPDIAARKVNILTLDKLMHLLKELPESVDDLANAFYELDADQVDTILASCVANACSAADLLKTDWNGKDDEFTAWVTKWTSIVK
ncbi:hypothetical protein AUEXF2481DRAFT_3383 [Aureobasidium subglaciale EXF-2481]|uniref:Cyclin-D1-binding protein 1-like N-terminal domain-containing protein n=1 Tax=Aureobasidium subglaciale (strain EXF-2481) TaxID=1043005 RepID=A0A074YIR7_AURSE|nr:uncharacterized protein AUEXF2481DRAFT_3383 [Aureobasidium subglaciale EXF-2481]KAI5199017.1 hypothetical protein E4T38_07214 [Aureobasidium subglaciale]KAI5217774.1 hypothetical protein E4T40_07225 [Aureobasidium subglaciale]KAI5220696.1 hypothetical protein E4T41_07379 [Aureobasidium subglaciale]KAI5258398.1 hypothetical protein E4T46_07356 [Aureobasidium subglaciale]KEQ97585.1 hypothetical protein AUEXF2481DRAFT_3383 [Aureobasidium subglaciale EXF-2481]